MTSMRGRNKPAALSKVSISLGAEVGFEVGGGAEVGFEVGGGAEVGFGDGGEVGFEVGFGAMVGFGAVGALVEVRVGFKFTAASTFT